MREIRLSGSEGGGAESNRLFLPLSKSRCLRLSRNVETGRSLSLKDKRGDSSTAQVCWHNFDLGYGKCLVGFKVVGNSQDWLLNVISLLGSLSNQHGTRTGLN